MGMAGRGRASTHESKKDPTAFTEGQLSTRRLHRASQKFARMSDQPKRKLKKGHAQRKANRRAMQKASRKANR